MSFIKKFTEKILELEFRPISNFYNSKIIDESAEYIGFIKQSGAISYGVVVINADLKYDYTGFYKDVLSFFRQLEKVIVVGIFVSENPDDTLLNFTSKNIEDYNESLLDIRWIADTGKGNLVVKGSQPDKILNIDKCVKSAFKEESESISNDLSQIQQKNFEKKQSLIKSSNIILTLALIIINGIIEIYTLVGGSYWDSNFIISNGAIMRDSILAGQWYRLITYMFIHGSLYHYLTNALSLYIFGSRVEKYYGRKNMLIIYFISGIFAGIASMIFNSGMAVGASGAIFGLMAGVFVYTKVKGHTMEGLDNYIMIIFVIIGILSGFLIENTDNWGHIGGFLAGILTSLVMLKGDKNESI